MPRIRALDAVNFEVELRLNPETKPSLTSWHGAFHKAHGGTWSEADSIPRRVQRAGSTKCFAEVTV